MERNQSTRSSESAAGQANNTDVYEKEFYLGSYSSLIVTEVNFGVSVGIISKPSTIGYTSTTTVTLAADIILCWIPPGCKRGWLGILES
jgi:hypothetical protein